jgi:hypothetical protein
MQENLGRAEVRAVVTLLLFLVGCGGDGGNPGAATRVPALPTPTPTPPPQARTLTFIDGVTREGVGGLNVTVDGKVTTTDEIGRVAVTAREGSVLATAGDKRHLDRRTLFASAAGDQLTLWPVESGRLDAEYFRRLVYLAAGAEGDLAVSMSRPEPGTYTMSASAALRGDGDAVLWLDMTAHEAAAVTNDKVRLAWKDSGGDVTFEVDPTDPVIAAGKAVALAYLRRSGRTIVGARLVFADQKYVKTYVAMHEVGHFLGLQHSAEGRDIMRSTYGYNAWNHFTDGEERAMTLMFQRTPGNTYPDTAPGAGSSADGPNEVVIVCSR